MSQLQAIIIAVTPFRQNCTILFDKDTKAGVVVDPGGDVDAIKEVIENNQLKIEAIWITHGHVDHIGAAADLRDALQVPIIGSQEEDAFLYDNVESSAAKYGLGSGYRNFQPDRWLKEGDVLEVAGEKFEVLHCPGHSPGHVVFINKAMHFAIVGDVLFNGSVGRTDLPGGDHEALIRSIKEKLLPLGDEYSFICGHGAGSRFGDERRGNPFLVG
ncbi:MBL fold metallo-hydrolase [Pseudochrobactrum kiredjianiae]|jgi:glyoxylase-like metal-dependent hydrolase (beta-lactamase superfamily II)|uniref:MBL fold metallo-hydrolase n=1 Tax=Pseudochrobactrum kiredjianiae TaxID=386305 RepID=A0ABW3V4T6_9HYPH|nr:MBL fold metallo-hydrolase [Pseudochrobactrum kiredjianiae]MDM7851041.1 MBL fold metallo-hydrolase [Pseudochrobactrum kiredjianiae]MDR2312514.1 MBL fold metallo-hydrolase [Brucellaceae bacterium]